MPPIRSLLAAALAAAALPVPALGHGGSERPPQRTIVCRDDRVSPMCARAWRADPQALYDWMEVNLPDVAGRHRLRIPDGRLCSAGRAKYAAFDAAGRWPTTRLVRGGGGRVTVTYAATAPHATRYFRHYLTRPAFDSRTDRLRWRDLDLVHDSGRLPAQARYRFRMVLPRRTRPAILYVVWQRSDSPEAFYGCSDVIVGGEGGARPAPRPAGPARPETGPVRVTTRVTEDWGSGYCARGTVVNLGRRAVDWRARLTVRGRITTSWDAVMTALPGAPAGRTRVRVAGTDSNGALRPGARTTFGWCAER